jgi:serine/threonine protein kinase
MSRNAELVALTVDWVTCNLRQRLMTPHLCRICGREFLEGEQFCPRDGARLSDSASSESSAAYQAEPVKDSRDSLVGSTLDARYRVLRVIGEGGMGVVYEALHVLIEKRVAIKVLRDTFTGRADVVERFRQEAKSASKIGHPNIVDVSDFGETPSGQSYIVMEMLTGEDLADVLARVRVLSPARAVRIVYQVARALHATHKKSIVHRDLKPENIYLVERDGMQDFVKVVDFGVAKMSDLDGAPGRKLTRTGMLFGTPEYMSPEQALGKPFDHRVDVYALGASLFELLTGRVPFTGENFMGILAQHGNAPLPSLCSVNAAVSVSPELEAIVTRALAKDPEDRFATMGAFADDLQSVPEMPARSATQTPVAPMWSLASHFAVQPDADGSQFSSPRRLNSPPPLPYTAPGRTPVPQASLSDSLVAMRQHAITDNYSRDAILVPPGSEFTRSFKLGMFGAILASGLLAALIAQRMNVPRNSGGIRATLPPIAASTPMSQAQEVAVRERESRPPVLDAVSVNAVAPAEPEESTLNTVEVRVRTQPRGASVSAVGTEARCTSAPCALAVPRGRPVTLRAETHSASVERTLTFDEEADVELHVGTRNKSTHPPSDLKVPSIFR